MTQTNRSHRADTHGTASRLTISSILPAILIMAALLAACNTTVGAGGRTGTTRVGGSVGSTGGVVGIGTSIGPKATVSGYGNVLHNGPSEVRNNHLQALDALKKGDYASAAAIFEATLESHPDHPDATYYLGLTRLYQGQREAGFALLKSYRDPDYYRMTTEVQRMAAFLEEKPDVPPKTVHETLNRYRKDGYDRDVSEHRDMINWR